MHAKGSDRDKLNRSLALLCGPFLSFANKNERTSATTVLADVSSQIPSVASTRKGGTDNRSSPSNTSLAMSTLNSCKAKQQTNKRNGGVKSKTRKSKGSDLMYVHPFLSHYSVSTLNSCKAKKKREKRGAPRAKHANQKAQILYIIYVYVPRFFFCHSST